ncbi:Uncharacterised protein [Actinobacillus lignieresii]|uniref:hypothetical protein n=1 Tax=Actinobacillus lignieresii TaxID=720 RepID=UPI000E1560A3|nr:hypothetical protein [Actinobacillus lignieresii]SUT96640.1 Uncharacterised protein [Actinobacillus lignieresii]
MIDNAFITHVSAVLADTHDGLSGSEISKYLSQYAVKYEIQIPYSQYPFPKDVPNKRTALERNLRCFTSEQQYRIIKELCSLTKFSQNERVKDILTKLSSRHSNYSNGIDQIQAVVVETKGWLDDYPNTKEHYESALNKKSNNIFTRNLLDDLRFSLESLIKDILNNSKSLENQKGELGRFFEEKGVSIEIRTLYIDKITKFYTDYQNNNVKHQDNYKEIEVDFILEQTTVLMRFLIKLHKSI